jgi:hypothetical protein
MDESCDRLDAEKLNACEKLCSSRPRVTTTFCVVNAFFAILGLLSRDIVKIVVGFCPS